jgi:hypothetical protein
MVHTSELERLAEIDWPKNVWIGCIADSCDNADYAIEAFTDNEHRIRNSIKFMILEVQANRRFWDDIQLFDWVIIRNPSEDRADWNLVVEFWHYCRDITSDNKSGIYKIFATAVGNANQLKWILNHYRELPHVLTIGVDKDGNLVYCNTRDPAVDMPLWIVMIEIFSFTEFESIEPEPAAPIAILVNASNAESALEMAKMATKTITDLGHCNFTITDLGQVDGRMVPSAAQVSTSYFPLEDQTGLEIQREPDLGILKIF